MNKSCEFNPKSMHEYKRKTQRGSTPKDVMEKAMKEVLIDKGACRAVANKYDIPQLLTNTTYDIPQIRPKDVMEKAMKEVLIDKGACRAVANKYDIPHVTLRRYCMNYRKQHAKNENTANVSLTKYGYFNNRFVFDDSQEVLLAEYLLKASSLYYGLSTNEVKSLAYEYGAKQNLKIPSSWIAAKQAGSDWLSSLIKRHPSLSLRTPESTSLSRLKFH